MAETTTKTTRSRAKAPARRPRPKTKTQAKVRVPSTVEIRTKVQAPARTAQQMALFVPLGATELVIEKTRELSGRVVSLYRDPTTTAIRLYGDIEKVYVDLGARGEKVATRLKKSPYARRALDQTKAARTQARAAQDTVRRAVGTATEPVLEVIKKVS